MYLSMLEYQGDSLHKETILMKKKIYWGIASLILIIGVVGTYFMLNGHWHGNESHEPVVVSVDQEPNQNIIPNLAV